MTVSSPSCALVRLALRDFRNHRETALELDGRHVCLSGANGSGKTNLLEAISLLGPGRGLRGAALTEIVRLGEGGAGPAGWAISARLRAGETERRLQVGLDRAPDGRHKRLARLDEAPVQQSELADLLRVIWLTPAMDRVFAGPAGDRRKFLDRQVLAHVPSHGPASAAYEKAMRDRNALLERGRPDPAWMEGLEQRMAEAGADIAIQRVRTVEAMRAAIDSRPDGAFPKSDLSLEGRFEQLAASGAGRSEIVGAFGDALRAGRSRDIAAGRTLEGVHRTDFVVVHRPKGMPAGQCSTGEQKALLMGLILASGRALFGRDFAPSPLLLLDEAAAHLDSDRRAALFDELAALGGQAWLTGADRSLFDDFAGRAQQFEVADGTVREV